MLNITNQELVVFYSPKAGQSEPFLSAVIQGSFSSPAAYRCFLWDVIRIGVSSLRRVNFPLHQTRPYRKTDALFLHRASGLSALYRYGVPGA